MRSCSRSTSSPLRGSHAATPCRGCAGTDPALVRLARGAPVRGAPADRVPREQRLAARARAALLPRGHEAPGVHAAVADRVRGPPRAARAAGGRARRPTARPPAAAGSASRATASRRRAGCRRRRSRPGRAAAPSAAATPRPTRSRKTSRPTSAASGPTWEKSGSISARPSRRLSRSAIRPPSANSSAKRSQLPRRRLLVDRDPARHAEVQAEVRAAVVGLDPQELPAPVRLGQPPADERRGDLARGVGAADVGVAVVDRDDLATRTRSICCLARSASGSSGISPAYDRPGAKPGTLVPSGG